MSQLLLLVVCVLVTISFPLIAALLEAVDEVYNITGTTGAGDHPFIAFLIFPFYGIPLQLVLGLVFVLGALAFGFDPYIAYLMVPMLLMVMYILMNVVGFVRIRILGHPPPRGP